MTVPAVSVACLSVVARRDGFMRVAGIHGAYLSAGFHPVQYLDESRGDVRVFADELQQLADRLLELVDQS